MCELKRKKIFFKKDRVKKKKEKSTDKPLRQRGRVKRERKGNMEGRILVYSWISRENLLISIIDRWTV